MNIELPTVPMGMSETKTNMTRSEADEEVPFVDMGDTLHLLKKRAENRVRGHIDALIVVSEWATREKYDIVSSQLVIAANVHDHSDKAIRLEGGFEIDVDGLDDYKYMSNIISSIDSEFDNQYIPKSAVESIIQLSPEVFTDD